MTKTSEYTHAGIVRDACLPFFLPVGVLYQCASDSVRYVCYPVKPVDFLSITIGTRKVVVRDAIMPTLHSIVMGALPVCYSGPTLCFMCYHHEHLFSCFYYPFWIIETEFEVSFYIHGVPQGLCFQPDECTLHICDRGNRQYGRLFWEPPFHPKGVDVTLLFTMHYFIN